MNSAKQSRSVRGRLVVPAFALLALCAFVHACGGGGGGGGDNPPAPPAPPGPSSFISTAQFPANGATDVPLAPLVLVSFNDIVNPATVSNTSVTLTETLSGTPVASTVTYVACNNRVQLVPNSPLQVSFQYTVSLTAALMDDDGEALTPITRTFTAGPNADGVRPVFDATGMTATPAWNNMVNGMEVMIDWVDATDNTSLAAQITYDVFVSTSGCFNFDVPDATTIAGGTTATLTQLTPRTLFSFAVRARDQAGNSSLNTDVVTATTFTSFSANVRSVVTSLCVACHQPGGQATQAPDFINMNYTTDALNYTSWVNAASQCAGVAGTAQWGTRVVPGDASTSFLWNKISEPTPACGVRMPFGQTPLSAGNQDIIFDWIEEGALNN
ncbi:MAG TPA: Ig-like domain-containing protein [Planctomycetota bacterium]